MILGYWLQGNGKCKLKFHQTTFCASKFSSVNIIQTWQHIQINMYVCMHTCIIDAENVSMGKFVLQIYIHNYRHAKIKCLIIKFNSNAWTTTFSQVLSGRKLVMVRTYEALPTNVMLIFKGKKLLVKTMWTPIQNICISRNKILLMYGIKMLRCPQMNVDYCIHF